MIVDTGTTIAVKSHTWPFELARNWAKSLLDQAREIIDDVLRKIYMLILPAFMFVIALLSLFRGAPRRHYHQGRSSGHAQRGAGSLRGSARALWPMVLA